MVIQQSVMFNVSTMSTFTYFELPFLGYIDYISIIDINNLFQCMCVFSLLFQSVCYLTMEVNKGRHNFIYIYNFIVIQVYTHDDYTQTYYCVLLHYV